MNIHESGEDYLESILMLKQRLGQVRSIDIVNDLGYTKPSISIAMKRLRENGFIEMDGEGFISLTEAGRKGVQPPPAADRLSGQPRRQRRNCRRRCLQGGA